MSLTFDPKRHKTFIPVNKNKYIGDVFPTARSNWETLFMQWLDYNPSILQWSSETLAIPYYDNLKKKNRRYYPDFTIQIKDASNKICIWVVEIKPAKEVSPPKLGKNKKEKTLLYESVTWNTNKAKWQAAEIYCRKRGWIFRILTEKDLFKGGKP